MIRKDVIYKGRVQGVGFRWTTNHISRQFSVTGTVQNRADGTVHLVVEGEQKEVEAFMMAIAERMTTNIKETTIHEADYLGEFEDFRVLY